MQKYQELWRDAVASTLSQLVISASGSPVGSESLVIETPPRPDMGDIAFPMFPFAKVLRKAPPLIAQEVARSLSGHIVKAAPGTVSTSGSYVNVRLDRAAVIADLFADIEASGSTYGRSKELEGTRIILEFSCPNTNKPLHLGHLRNDAIGESLARILRESGATVLKTNLINDRGVHICQSMLAYKMFANGETPESSSMKGDHFVGKYYVLYHQWAKDNPQAEEDVRQMLRAWEEGDAEVRALWEKMNGWVMGGIEQTYRRTGTSFDTIYRESDIYELGRAEVLKGVQSGIFQRDPDGSVWVDLTVQGLDREVLLRADGTTLYLTQDIGLAIKRSEDWPFDRLIYVVASEQRYHFKVLFEVMKLLGRAWAGDLFHLAYGMVHLPEGKMKSREGTVVDADELIDELEGLAREEIAAKEREEEVGDMHATARDVALAALNYYLLQIFPHKDMTFDPRESISFNGNTGPYLQYTGARISSMLRKFEERKKQFEGGAYSPQVLALQEEWEIAKSLASFPEAVAAAARDYNPSGVAVYLFELCKSFSRYYQDHPVLRNEDKNLVLSRISLVKGVLTVLRSGFRLIGIPFLEAM
jgi:arginyl-tRNA synthetase